MAIMMSAIFRWASPAPMPADLLRVTRGAEFWDFVMGMWNGKRAIKWWKHALAHSTGEPFFLVVKLSGVPIRSWIPIDFKWDLHWSLAEDFNQMAQFLVSLFGIRHGGMNFRP